MPTKYRKFLSLQLLFSAVNQFRTASLKLLQTIILLERFRSFKLTTTVESQFWLSTRWTQPILAVSRSLLKLARPCHRLNKCSACTTMGSMLKFLTLASKLSFWSQTSSQLCQPPSSAQTLLTTWICSKNWAAIGLGPTMWPNRWIKLMTLMSKFADHWSTLSLTQHISWQIWFNSAVTCQHSYSDLNFQMVQDLAMWTWNLSLFCRITLSLLSELTHSASTYRTVRQKSIPHSRSSNWKLSISYGANHRKATLLLMRYPPSNKFPTASTLSDLMHSCSILILMILSSS